LMGRQESRPHAEQFGIVKRDQIGLGLDVAGARTLYLSDGQFPRGRLAELKCVTRAG
jgi:hypothetical protein